MPYTDLGEPQSRNEAILMNMLGATYDLSDPQSRIEYLLIQILENGGGGGGGTSNYNALVNKPYINNVELKGDLSLDDLGINCEDVLSTTSEKPVMNKTITIAINKKLGIAATLPTAAIGNLGKQFLYIGTTTETYEKGVIYECQTVAGSSPTAYKWEAISASKIVIDDELDDTSENPVQNKIVTLALNDKLGIAETMPTAAAKYERKELLYVGATTETYTKGIIYECQEITPATDPKTYHWVAITHIGIDIDDHLDDESENPVQNKIVTEALNKRLVITNVMPTAAAAYEGMQRLYIGATNVTYTKGNIYECQEVTPATDPKTYHWVIINKAFIEVDDELDDESTNPVQNMVITLALDKKLTLSKTIPAATADLEGKDILYVGVSGITYKKGFIYECQEVTPATDPKTYEWNVINAVAVEIDDQLDDTSENPVQNKVITEALGKKLTISSTMPTAAAANEGTQILYVGASNANYAKGFIYESQEVTPATDPKTYEWNVINKADIVVDAALDDDSENPVQNMVVTLTLGKKLTISSTMPTAAATNENTQILYVGASNANYAKGTIYECNEVTPATDPKTYHWVVINKADIEIDAALDDNSENPVQNKVVKQAIDDVDKKLYPTIAGVAINTKGAMELTSKDLNNYQKSGFYIATNCSHAPGINCYLMVMGHKTTGYASQFAVDATSGEIYTRCLISGSWQPWKEINWITYEA